MMNFKPKEDKIKPIPTDIEFHWKFEGLVELDLWYYPSLVCSKCGAPIEEVTIGFNEVRSNAYGRNHISADSPTSRKADEYINRKISEHYLEFHRGFE